MDIAYFMPAFAWAGICVNFVVIPFFSKSDSLFKDLIDSGARDTAFAFIDAQKLIPALAELTNEAWEARQRLIAQGLSAEFGDILQEFDYVDLLSAAQKAIDEKTHIEASIASLRRLGSRLWMFGIVHSLSVLAVPSTFLISNEALRLATLTSVLLLSIVTFLAIAAGLVVFARRRDALHEILGKNRGQRATYE